MFSLLLNDVFALNYSYFYFLLIFYLFIIYSSWIKLSLTVLLESFFQFRTMDKKLTGVYTVSANTNK